VTEGEAACFTVAVSGRPAPRVTWQHNGIDVVEGGSPYFEVVHSPDGLRHSLRIGEVFADDAGDVCITAENDAGAVSASARLAVVRRQFYYYLSTPRKPNDVIVISLSVFYRAISHALQFLCPSHFNIQLCSPFGRVKIK